MAHTEPSLRRIILAHPVRLANIIKFGL